MRRRSEPHTFEQRLEAHRTRLERELAGLPRCSKQRDDMAARIEQIQAAAEMYDFLKRREEASAPRRSQTNTARPIPSTPPIAARSAQERSSLHAVGPFNG
jgi:citrate synthase